MNKSIPYNNSSIYYRVEGNGVPVILIHGFAEDGAIWNDLAERLKDKFKLIIPDLPGSGKSTLMNSEPALPAGRSSIVDGGWSIELFAESIYKIIQQESVSSLIMIGHSMGGYITLAFAEKYPHLLSAFGLFHSTSYPDSEEKKEARRKSITFIRQHGAAKFIEQSTPNLFSENFKKKHPDIVQEQVALYTNFSASVLVQYYEAMIERPDRTEIVKKFKGPILFIMGKHDTAIPLEHSLQQCHLPNLSYTLILENSGHMGMLEEAEKSGHFIENFLTEIEIANPYQRYS